MDTPQSEGLASPSGSRRAIFLRRVIWCVVVVALVATLVRIYFFLAPRPALLAGPEDFELDAGEQFEIGPLPMGGRYRLRACDHASELQVVIGKWSSDWVRLPVNPLDAKDRDLKIDGRSGGQLRIKARTPTGRLLLFHTRDQVTCRGDDPTDKQFSVRSREEQLPAFDCDEEALARYDREALELLFEEIAGSPPPGARHVLMGEKRRKPAAKPSRPLSPEEQACLDRITAMASQAPAPGVLPAQSGGELEDEEPAPVPAGSANLETGVVPTPSHPVGAQPPSQAPSATQEK